MKRASENDEIGGMPTISVVIPLYNKEPYVARAIKSVLNQTVNDLELIVVDDGSTDNGPAVVKRIIDSRIRLVSQTNGGVSSARNRGIRESTADLIAFLDADDAWHDCFLKCIMELVDLYPTAGAYATAFSIDKGQGISKFDRKRIFNQHSQDIGLLDYLKSGGLTSSSIVVRKAVFDAIGNFKVGYKMAEDLDMFLRIAAYYTVAYHRKICASWFYAISDSATKTNLPGHPSPLMATWDEIQKDERVDRDIKRSVKAFIINKLTSDIGKYLVAGQKKMGAKVLKSTLVGLGFNYKLLISMCMFIFPTTFFRLKQTLRLRLVRLILSVRPKPNDVL